MAINWGTLRRTRWLWVEVLAVLFIHSVLYFAIFFSGSTHILRVGTAMFALLLLPGYALTTVAFPRESQITGIERLALSFGMSVVLVPPLGLALWTLPWYITPWSVFLITSIATAVLLIIGITRRLRLRRDVRFELQYRRYSKKILAVFRTPSRIESALNVVLVAAVVLAAISLLTPFVAPQDASTFTEFSVLTENRSGELVATGYPTDFSKNEREPLIFNVENHEQANTTYTVVVQQTKMNAKREVITRTKLNRFQKRVPAGATWRVRHSVAPTIEGERTRLTYLLYKGSPPSNPTSDNAYRHLYISINVSSPE